MMKKLSILAVALFATCSVFAQKGGDGPQNVIKVNPLGLLFGQASIGYERAINEKSSFVIAPTFGGFKLGGFSYSQFGLGGEYRFYLSKTKTAPEGIYVGPGVGFNSGKVKESQTSTKVNFTSFYGKAIIGNQWIFNSGFVIDLNVGLQYSSFSYKDNSSSVFNGLKGSGVLPALAFAIGYAF
jgi:Protein of unknown function (DUF3575)